LSIFKILSLLIRKGFTGRASNTLSEDLVTGIVPEDMPKESAGRLTLHPGNVDSLAFQAALADVVSIPFMLIDSA
jgi:hypothetical protein